MWFRLLRLFVASTLVSASFARSSHILRPRAQSTIEQPLSIVQPPISFFWTTLSVNDSNRAIPQCSNMTFVSMDNPGSAANTTLPVFYTVAPVDSPFVPQSSLATQRLGIPFGWQANLPVNTSFSFAMRDAGNTSGGAVYPLYTIVPGSTNCTLRQPDSSNLTFVVNPSNTPCDELKIEITNGVAPYNISVLAGQSGMFANLAGVNESTFYMSNIVPAGQTFYIYVTDSSGAVSFVSPKMTSGLGQTTCNSIQGMSNGSDGPPLGAIIGGVLGGIAGAFMIALLAWWWLRRRTAKVEQQYQHDQHVSEYTNLDGSKPTVHPFVVPPRGADYDDSTWSSSMRKASPRGTQAPPLPAPNAYDHPYLQQQGHAGYAFPPPSSQPRAGSPTSPVTPHSYHSAGGSSGGGGGNGGGGFAYPTPSSASAVISHEPYSQAGSSAGYDPLVSTYNPTTSSSAIDGLVDPDEFQPRLAGHYAPAPGSLPPGARPS